MFTPTCGQLQASTLHCGGGSPETPPLYYGLHAESRVKTFNFSTVYGYILLAKE